ncbi:hypothetical protein MMPV_003739 [Pyropia vietnamensis]
MASSTPARTPLALRVWVAVTGMAGLSAAVGALTAPASPIDTLYREAPPGTDAGPFARMYATWLALSTVTRLVYAGTPSPDGGLTAVTAATYAVALGHFAGEIGVTRTVPLLPGGVAPLVVASVSLVWMGVWVRQRGGRGGGGGASQRKTS